MLRTDREAESVFRRSLFTLAWLLSACTLPGAPAVPVASSGAWNLDVLAVTTMDVETQNPKYRVHLRWPSAPNARIYEVVRKLDGKPANVKATLTTPGWLDDALGAGQSASYKVHTLSGESKLLTASDERPVTVLKNEVPAPVGLKPADNAVLGVGELPLLSWDRVENADWYYVQVSRADDDRMVYSALTTSTSLKFGDRSPLQLDKFPDILPVQANAGIARGVVHRWTVSSVRTTGGSDPARVTAVDIRSSEVHRFSPGG
ncbi:MAG: hypothetical protein VKP62_13035 [Candidatus Sericytochromatia bacterium]|nr:hypothetical protein [Candidatus Sericytochromatia bacterium]